MGPGSSGSTDWALGFCSKRPSTWASLSVPWYLWGPRDRTLLHRAPSTVGGLGRPAGTETPSPTGATSTPAWPRPRRKALGFLVGHVQASGVRRGEGETSSSVGAPSPPGSSPEDLCACPPSCLGAQEGRGGGCEAPRRWGGDTDTRAGGPRRGRWGSSRRGSAAGSQVLGRRGRGLARGRVSVRSRRPPAHAAFGVPVRAGVAEEVFGDRGGLAGLGTAPDVTSVSRARGPEA